MIFLGLETARGKHSLVIAFITIPETLMIFATFASIVIAVISVARATPPLHKKTTEESFDGL